MGRFVFDLMQNKLNLQAIHSLPRKVGHPSSPPEVVGRAQRSNFQGRPRGGSRKKQGQGQEVGCRKSLHPLSAVVPVWPQTSTPVPSPAARPPDLSARARAPSLCPGRGSDSIPPPPSHLPTAAAAAAGLWLQGRAPGSSNLGAEPGARIGTRARPAGSPAVREGWGIPGDPGRGGVPGRGAGGGVGHRSFQFVPLFEIGAGGALRSRDGASPIGGRPCLRVPGSNAAAAPVSGGRDAAGRVRRAGGRLVGRGGRGRPGGRRRGPRGWGRRGAAGDGRGGGETALPGPAPSACAPSRVPVGSLSPPPAPLLPPPEPSSGPFKVSLARLPS